jgi:DegV family protein with EDD domain
MNSVFTVSDLKYLRRGGRISATLAIAGTILNIKPILKADANGKMSFSGKERGRKKALSAIADAFAETVIHPESQTVAICHADSEEDALALADLIRERGAKDIVINWYDICTGSHVGPGTVAVFYLGKERGKVSEAKSASPSGLPVRASK